MHIAQVEERPGMKDRQQNAIARRGIANVQVAAPFTLPVHAGRHLALGRDPERADKGSDRPGNALIEVQHAVAG